MKKWGDVSLGSIDFIKEIKDKYLKDKKGDRNLSELRAFSIRPAIQKIEKEVDLVFGPDNTLSKKVKLYFCYRYSGKKLKEIGAYFDIGESGVSHSSRRISLKISADKKLKNRLCNRKQAEIVKSVALTLMFPLHFITQRSVSRMFEEAGYKITWPKGINKNSSWKFQLFNFLTLGFYKDTKYLQFVCIAKTDK